jgi:HSP20 family molecular chaperone IbpA
MRLRYKYVTYHFGADPATQQSLQRHYHQLMDELLRQGQHHPLPPGAAQWRPPADIHETPEAVLVKMELAGMREEDIEVTLYEDALVVTGRREDDSEHGDTVYYHEAQIRYGPFRAEILLPASVQRDAVEARYENGFLRVLLPKAATPHAEEHRRGVARNGESAGSLTPQGPGSLAGPSSVEAGFAPVTPPERSVANLLLRGGAHHA